MPLSAVATRAAAASGVALLALAGAASGVPPPPRLATASCELAILQLAGPSDRNRVVLDRVSLPPVTYVNQLAKAPSPGAARFAKVGVDVQAGTAVTLEVPVGQRRNYALTYGDSGGGSRIRYAATSVEFQPCDPATHGLRWTGWGGGFLLRKPACVPLLVHVDGRSERILVGIGRPCPPA